MYSKFRVLRHSQQQDLRIANIVNIYDVGSREWSVLHCHGAMSRVSRSKTYIEKKGQLSIQGV